MDVRFADPLILLLLLAVPALLFFAVLSRRGAGAIPVGTLRFSETGAQNVADSV